MIKVISVSAQGNKHLCSPSPLEVRPGDQIGWKGNVIVFFPEDTPFVEGRGPFGPQDVHAVKATATAGQRFRLETVLDGSLKPTVGDIIVI